MSESAIAAASLYLGFAEVRFAHFRVALDFIDNGSGIDEAHQDMIFEKFTRASDHSKAGGAGLGFAICREIISNLGGQITYLLGQRGAAFRVSLPIG